MRSRNIVFLFFCLLTIVIAPLQKAEAKNNKDMVVLGIERIDDYAGIFAGKRVAIQRIARESAITLFMVYILKLKINIDSKLKNNLYFLY